MEEALSGKLKMVDSKEIEELRALAFASIPTVPRKAQCLTGNSILGGKRKHASVDTEEGEIVSDEDAVAAAAMAMATSMGISASKSRLDCTSSGSFREAPLCASVKQRAVVPVSLEVIASISTESPSIVTVVPSHTHVPGSEENQDSDFHRPLMVPASRDNNATSRLESMAKSEETKCSQNNEKLMHPLRTSKTTTGSLPSRIPTVPLPAGGIRKEADAFLASLNIPATANPSHLSGFVGDRNNSLVIKFSDDDSDSDGEQDGQVAIEKSNNKTWCVNEPQMSGSTGTRMGLSTQSTSGLKSEIDRVKKQIAAIERAKGMVGVSPGFRPSKSTAMDMPRHSNFKVSGTPRTAAPVDLESLRQQIAAKESELKRRKERGLKESLNNGNVIVSSWLIDAVDLTQASDARFLPLEKSENESGGAEVPVEDAPTMSGSQLNEVSNNMNGTSLKGEEAFSCGPNSEAGSIPCHQVLDVPTIVGPLPMVPAVETSTVSSDSQFLDSQKDYTIVEALSCENTKPALESLEWTLKAGKTNDMIRNNTNTTPKRKRHEFDQAGKFSLPPLRGESAKKQKRKGSSISAQSLMLNRSKEAGNNPARLSDSSVDGPHASISKVSDGEKHVSQVLEVEENATSVQGMPKFLSTTTEPKQDLSLHTGKTCVMLKAADGTNVVGLGSVEKTNSHSAHTVNFDNENAVSEIALLSQPNTSKVPPSVGDGLTKITKVTSQQDVIFQSDDTFKHVETSKDVTLSPLSSPSRAIVEQQGASTVFSEEQKMHEGILVAASSTCSSAPVWAYSNHLHNPKMVLLQGVDDQKLDFGTDALWKLQEEEDAIDKELEEAQQNRRRCEVREHFARRQYRDAQEALHSANLQCEMLFQKRELLSASVKAAQLRFCSSKSSLVSRHGEGALIPLGSPKRIKTSFWARQKGECEKLYNHLSDQDHDDFDPDFSSVPKQSKISSRFPLDGNFISEKLQQGAIVSRLEEPVVFDPSASKSRVCQPDSPVVFVHERNSTAERVVESADTTSLLTVPKDGSTVSTLLQEPSCQSLLVQEPSIGSVVRGIVLDSGNLDVNLVSQSGNGEEKHVTADENRPPITTLAAAAHVKSGEKESHHGFSSASFATDLEGDTNQNSLMIEKSSTDLMGQKAAAKQCSLLSQPLSLHTAPASLNKQQASNKSTYKCQSGSLKVFPSLENDISIGALKDLASHPFSDQVIECETQHEPCSVESLLGEKAPPSSQKQQQLLDGRILLDLTLKETFNNPSSADTLDRQAYSRFGDDVSNKLWSVERKPMDLNNVQDDFKGTYLDKEKMVKDPSVGQLGRQLVMQELQNSGVSMSDLCRKAEDSKQLVRTLEAELETGSISSMVDKVPVILGDFKLEESFNSFVPSARLNLLFSHTLHLHTFVNGEQQITTGVTDEGMQCVSGSYESPLCAFHSYGGSSAHSQSHAIDPHRILCMYEHRGKCNNDECIWQHKRDYMVGSTWNSKQLHGIAGVSEFQEVSAEKERKGLNSTHSGCIGCEKADGSIVALQKSRKWNIQVTKAPIYRTGSYLRKTQCPESFFSYMMLKGQLGFGQPFLALHRWVPLDMPCLIDSSLKLQTLNDDSAFSRQLRMEDRLWIEDEGQHSGTLEDTESLLEAALELFDYDLKIQKSEIRKSVLYVLSRGLEANPRSVAVWVVYLHLFSRWEKSFSKDDLFVHAVQHNKGSYELWMMFINSRRQLMDRLKAYESAIIALGSEVELQGHPLESKSPILLDLALQKLNFMCTSHLHQEAASWIDVLTAVASENVEDIGSHEASSSILLTSMVPSDLCILWICCAYVMLQKQLPINVVECLGCKQQRLSFQNMWADSKNRSSCDKQVMKIMRIGASDGKGCMKLDAKEPANESFQSAKEVYVINLVQCAAVCEGLDCCFTIANKYFKFFSPSVELALLRAQLEEHQKGKLASLDIFEEALTRWPLNRSGKVILWNQYIACAYKAKGSDFVKVLLARCANEIYNSDSSRSVSKSLGSSTPTILNTTRTVKSTRQQNSLTTEEVSNTIRNAFQLLPSIVKRQLSKDFGCSSQRFSNQDVVFGYVNLAFLEMLNEDGNSTRNALQSSLNVAADADSMRHCLEEAAVFASGELDSSTVLLAPSVHSCRLLGLLDRCMLEMQLLGTVHSLSRGFCESIKKRQVRQFVSTLLDPQHTDSTFLNSILESIHGPTLLPKETQTWRVLLDFSEKILEILPSNVRLAISLCRIVQSRVAELSTGPATLFWCTSLLIDSLCQASPEAPEPSWVEAGGFVRMLEIDILLEEFYWLAISVHPFSASLWHGLLMVSSKTGNFNSALESAKERGVELDPQFISS